MEIETMVISTETIKPSSPTPKSLQKHRLSFLDQLTPPLFLPAVYFYHSNPEIPNSEKTKQLKKSLSETLSRFYPLAGKLVRNLYVDCDDGGALFSEAEANCNLSQVIYNPNPKDMNKFLPYRFDELQDFSMAVQATYFRCGGVAVGLLISHKIADSSSSILFANTWSAVSRNGDGGSGVPLPKFDGAAYFPPVDWDTSVLRPAREIEKEEVATRIFTFSADTIALLRRRYSSDDGGLRPSRVEALSVFIWTRFAAATRARSDPKKTFAVQYPVNLWARIDPPLSDHHFGNRFVLATAKPAVGDDGVELVRKLKKAVDAGSVARLERTGGADEGELVGFSFKSLCRSALYEADFGWGEPVWVGSPGLTRKNLAIFTDTKSGGGIEALIHLSKQDMKKFESDLELQIFIETNFGADLQLPKSKSKL